MSKYAPLRRYLESRSESRLVLTFDQIEGTLGFALPASARKHNAWWSNETSETHSHASMWRSAGWMTSNLNLAAERIEFRRLPVAEARRSASNYGSTQTAARTAPSAATSILIADSVALVSCGKRKRTTRCPAKDLYISQLFMKTRAVVESRGGRWFILSAMHGLVNPNTPIAPYEQTLIDKSRAERQEWALNVAIRIQAEIKERSKITIFAGAAYTQHLVPLLEDRGFEIIEPLSGLGIGQRLAALDRMIVDAH